MPTNKLLLLNTSLQLFSLVGFLLSVYSYYVEIKIQRDKNYVALCDISEHVSCSKAFNSEYGRGFGIIKPNSVLAVPNSVYGMIMYSITFVLAFSNQVLPTQLLMYLALASNFVSVYLAYVLLFVLRDFCVVCVSTYIVNFGLLLVSHNKLCHISYKVKSSLSSMKKMK